MVCRIFVFHGPVYKASSSKSDAVKPGVFLKGREVGPVEFHNPLFAVVHCPEAAQNSISSRKANGGACNMMVCFEAF